VVLAGVSAALHVAKLPPAISALQAALGISLLQAGFLLSLVQLAGMTVGVAFGVFADGIGLKRSMVVGSLLLGAASALGGAVQAVPALMALRALEGFGFLLVVLPAPGLIRQIVPRERLNLTLGLWSAYMPSAPLPHCCSGPCASPRSAGVAGGGCWPAFRWPWRYCYCRCCPRPHHRRSHARRRRRHGGYACGAHWPCPARGGWR